MELPELGSWITGEYLTYLFQLYRSYWNKCFLNILLETLEIKLCNLAQTYPTMGPLFSLIRANFNVAVPI